jgi:hypothetical protein
MIAALTVAYLACFWAAALPAIARIYRRKSSADCSVWREWFVLAGICLQLIVFVSESATWPVLISPIASGISLSTLLAVVYRFR